jgi:Putative auto-transporter adhesin, head GIN domain
MKKWVRIMKKVNKYLLVAGLIVVVGIVMLELSDSLYPGSAVLQEVPQRMSANELAQFANYTRISVRGDFDLEVVQGLDYSIDYAPLNEFQGGLVATVEDNTLMITGFGNHQGADAAILKISVPVLDTLEVFDVREVKISSFMAVLMNLRFTEITKVFLQNNVLGNLDFIAQDVGEITLQENNFIVQNFDIRGQTNLNISGQ